MAIRIFIVGSKEMATHLSVLPGKKAPLRFSGECATGEEAVRKLRNRRVDVVLVNFNLPCMDGFECVRKLRKLLPATPILMFMTGEQRMKDDDLIFTALHAGANGYLPGNLPRVELAWTIVQTHKTAKQRCPVFVMLYESDRHLSRSARHWHKITSMLNAATVGLSYGKEWRRVMVRMKNKIAIIEDLVPSLVVPGHQLAAA